MFLVARRNPPEVFDPIEEALDAVALAIERGAEAGFPCSVGFRRNVGRGPGFLNASAQPIGVIGLVGQQDGVLAQAGVQSLGGRAVRRLSRCLDQLQRQASAIDQRVNFGGQSAAISLPRSAKTQYLRLVLVQALSCPSSD